MAGPKLDTRAGTQRNGAGWGLIYSASIFTIMLIGGNATKSWKGYGWRPVGQA